MNVGIILKRLRLMKAVSQEEIAKLLFVERTTYAKWERNQVMLKLDQAQRIAAIYGIPLSLMIEFMENERLSNLDIVTRGIRDAELKFKEKGTF